MSDAPPRCSPTPSSRTRACARGAARLALALALLAAGRASAADDTPANATAAAMAAVAAGEAVVIMRHALAPGTGDPPGFDVEDCATQRNLSAAGREQARRIGRRLAAALGTDAAEVYSSAWCRCLETARLLGLGEVGRLPPLDSFFGERDRGPASTAALEAWIEQRLTANRSARDGEPVPAVLVTHQVNVTALTGVYPASGEAVVFGRPARDGTEDPVGPALEVLARLPTDG